MNNMIIKNKVKNFIGLIIIIIILIAIICYYNQGKRMHTISEVSALTRAVSEISETKLKQEFSFKSNWKILDESQYKNLMKLMVEEKTIKGDIKIDDSLLVKDYWGNPFLIALKLNEEEEIKIFVLSAGPDGSINTKDDIYQDIVIHTKGSFYTFMYWFVCHTASLLL